MEADPLWCYLWWYLQSRVVVFSEMRGFGGGMPLTDIAVKKAKIAEMPYRLKDSGGMFPLLHQQAGDSGAGNIGSTRSRSS